MKADIQRAWWRALRLVGLEKVSSDSQYLANISDRGPRSPHTITLVKALCNGGRLVEFGCGEGSLPFLLPDGCYDQYWGFDISDAATNRAKRRAAASGRRGAHFEQLDMADWMGTDGLSLILRSAFTTSIRGRWRSFFCDLRAACRKRDGSSWSSILQLDTPEHSILADGAVKPIV